MNVNLLECEPSFLIEISSKIAFLGNQTIKPAKTTKIALESSTIYTRETRAYQFSPIGHINKIHIWAFSNLKHQRFLSIQTSCPAKCWISPLKQAAHNSLKSRRLLWLHSWNIIKIKARNQSRVYLLKKRLLSHLKPKWNRYSRLRRIKM